MKNTFKAIIQSLLDQDLYKFTIWQAMFHHVSSNFARYEFMCRNTPAIPLARLVDEVNAQLDHLCTLRFTKEELDYLATRSYMKRDFLDFLRLFQFNREFIRTEVEGDTLKIIAEGPQVHVMGFEIFVLSLINELHARAHSPEVQAQALSNARRILKEKIEAMRQALDGVNTRFPFEMFEFGTRRRLSREWQEEVIETLLADPQASQWLRGTSNVLLAKKYNLVPIGTMAHEWLQTFQAVPGTQLKYSQQQALEVWVKEYRGELGIALTDVIGMDAFLKDFDLYFAKLYDGMRHDSGPAVQWGEKAIAHYERLKIEPSTKRLVFSDGLKFAPSTVKLHIHFADTIRTGMGIGTDLTNDTGGVIPALNVVMKLTTCNGQPTAKISDSPGKTMCKDPVFLNYLRQVFGLAPEQA